MPTSYLQSIQHKLQRLRWRFYLVVLWHCLLIYGLLIWVAIIGQLALGRVMWPLVWWGLLIPAAYAGHRIIKRPSLSQIACLADERCQLRDKLVTAWQYRHSEQPVLPLLLRQAAGDLGKIKPSLIFSFRVSRWLWIVVMFLLVSSGYFNYYSLYPPPSPEGVQPARGNQLSILAGQLEEFSQELNQMTPGGELPQLVNAAGRLQELAQRVEDSALKPQVMAQLKELKQELVQSLPPEIELPQEAKAGDKPALLEIEIRSKRLKSLMYKLKQQGLSPEQIQNRILRELVSLMDRLIQFKLPVKGRGPMGSAAQSAKTGLSQTGKGGSKAPTPGILGATDTGISEYAESASQGYQPQDIGQSAWDSYWISPQAEVEKLIPNAGYSYLSPRYQQRVQSVLVDQRIPLAYRRQVRDYFDALR